MAKANWFERMIDVATLGAGLAAVVVAGVLLVRTIGPDPSSGGPEGVSGWQRYAGVGHRLGPETAAVTIIEFGDYQCPYCRASEAHLEAIRREYGNDVSLVYRHFPLSGHGSAYSAARAAECAGKQDRFWEFHELLYSTTRWIEDTSEGGLAGLAEQAGVVSVEQFTRCLADREIDDLVNADLAAGRELGIRGTPTFLVNGELHAGVLDSLRFKVLFDELGEGRP
ncbi:MAG: DsbA family protein [Gemmatimonadetes bacterium]|nr:DsbA family protein [Gemmatimonadota bacterium]MYC91906.1 DsbA family protein [Gemmatimonadota bacterium]MYJ17328.1 DsbA family protein [Gemmatimonadota bacterium]